ncbi:MAG: hypothetical protein Q4G70_13260 [Pseudomonadota bacterium]|nr:hypothetical protein [Pseudomonadota bacterium]
MLRKLALFVLSLAALTACSRDGGDSSAPAPGATQGATTASASPPGGPSTPDSSQPGRLPQPITASQLDLLRHHLGESEARALAHYLEGYQKVTSDAEFADHYDAGVALFNAVMKIDGEGLSTDEEIAEEARALDTLFALRLGCMAECSQIDLFYSLDDLARLASATRGDLDDRFIALKRQAEGYSASPIWADSTGDAPPPDVGHYRPTSINLNFLNQTWDYGGHSLLGNGASQRFLADSWQFMQDTPLFGADIQHIRETLLTTAINNGTYDLPRERALSELRAILAAGILSEDETRLLQTLREHMERGTNEYGVPFEFDCANKECATG